MELMKMYGAQDWTDEAVAKLKADIAAKHEVQSVAPVEPPQMREPSHGLLRVIKQWWVAGN